MPGSADRVRYGDRVTIDEPNGYESASVRATSPVAGISGCWAARTGSVPRPRRSGHRRVVPAAPSLMSRAARPGPIRASIAGPHGTNYGCAINSNLAAMIANPDDLVRGQDASGRDTSVTAGRAIRTYRERTPTGSQPLPAVTTRGGQ